MSAPSALEGLTVPETPSIPERLTRVRDQLTRDTLLAPVHFVGFWAAVSLPFLHVPLVATGLDTPQETLTFLALLTLNVVAFVLGKPYKAD